MNNNTNTFQIIAIGIFIALGVGGVIVFAMFKGFGQHVNPYGGSVVIWGTLDDAPFVDKIAALTEKDSDFRVVSYVQKDPRSFENELVNALAEGKGPDIVLIPQDLLLKERGKIDPIPYAQFPVRNFTDTYIDGAEVFLLHDGIYAIPVAVDPLLMYWNKDIFATKGLAQPPRTWEELVGATVPAIVEKTFSLDITRAAVAFGGYANIQNAKDIISLLFIQAGSNMIVDTGNQLSVQLNQGNVQGVAPADASLDFYTLFSNPTKSVYSWNTAMPLDKNEFLSGDLALYFGFGSEIGSLRNGNPNLNFDVAEVPQQAEVSTKKGIGRIYGFARMRNSANGVGATNALYQLIGQQDTEIYAQSFGMGPVYRASFGVTPRDPFMTIVNRASLVARAWRDPNPEGSNGVFKQMIDDITSGRREVAQSIGDAEQRLQQLIAN